MCCIGRGMKVEHYPIYRVAKYPRQQMWNWPTALNHLIVGCTSISRGGHSFFFVFFSSLNFLCWMLRVRIGQIQCSLLYLWLWGLSAEVETDSSAIKVSEGSEGVRESFSEKRGQLIGSLRISLLSKNVGFLWDHNDAAVSLWEEIISPSAWSILYFLNLNENHFYSDTE